MVAAIIGALAGMLVVYIILETIANYPAAKREMEREREELSRICEHCGHLAHPTKKE